eukprot:gene13129-biopygen5002
MPTAVGRRQTKDSHQIISPPILRTSAGEESTVLPNPPPAARTAHRGGVTARCEPLSACAARVQMTRLGAGSRIASQQWTEGGDRWDPGTPDPGSRAHSYLMCICPKTTEDAGRTRTGRGRNSFPLLDLACPKMARFDLHIQWGAGE